MIDSVRVSIDSECGGRTKNADEKIEHRRHRFATAFHMVHNAAIGDTRAACGQGTGFQIVEAAKEACAPQLLAVVAVQRLLLAWQGLLLDEGLLVFIQGLVAQGLLH